MFAMLLVQNVNTWNLKSLRTSYNCSFKHVSKYWFSWHHQITSIPVRIFWAEAKMLDMDSKSSRWSRVKEVSCPGDLLSRRWLLSIWSSDKELASGKMVPFLSRRWLLSRWSPAVSWCPHVRGRGPTHGRVSLPCLDTSCWPWPRQHNLRLSPPAPAPVGER